MIFSRLMDRLHRVFDKNPESVPVMTLSYSGAFCFVSIAGGVLSIRAHEGTATFTMTGSLSDLLAEINSLSYLSATIYDESLNDFLAVGLYETAEQDIKAVPDLDYPTALLWAEIKTYALALEEQNRQIAAATNQLSMNTAEDDWLDEWADRYCRIPRNDGESDATYFNRAKYEIFSLKVNNKALMKIIMGAVNYYVDVRDLGKLPEGIFYTNDTKSLTNTGADDSVLFLNSVLFEILDAHFGVYTYSGNLNNLAVNEKKAIVDIVNRYKAAGTKPVYYAPADLLLTNDAEKTVNNSGYNVGPRQLGWTEVVL